MMMEACRPPDSTEPKSTHLLFNGEEEIPWTWTGGGWCCVPRGKVFDADSMAQLGWQYRRAQ